jgi:hypothetical protein
MLKEVVADDEIFDLMAQATMKAREALVKLASARIRQT